MFALSAVNFIFILEQMKSADYPDSWVKNAISLLNLHEQVKSVNYLKNANETLLYCIRKDNFKWCHKEQYSIFLNVFKLKAIFSQSSTGYITVCVTWN